jgi:hypothetical protein
LKVDHHDDLAFLQLERQKRKEGPGRDLARQNGTKHNFKIITRNMAAIAVADRGWELVSFFPFLAILIDYLGWQYIPRISKRWAGLSDDTKLRLILRLSTAPPKVHYLWASYKILYYTDEAIRLDQGNVQSSVRSTCR